MEKIKLRGAQVVDVEKNVDSVYIIAKQNKPEKVICPYCGAEVTRMRYTKARTYKDSPIMYYMDTYLALPRVEAKCQCGKSFTVPSALVHEGSRMTSTLKSYIDFLLTNPYGLSNQEMADEAGVSEKTIRRAKKGVL